MTETETLHLIQCPTAEQRSKAGEQIVITPGPCWCGLLSVEQRIEKLRASWETRIRADMAAKYPNLTPDRVSLQVGKRYVRIVRHTGSVGADAAGFVDLTDGAIYYPAGWKGPQKNRARGNVNAEDFGLSAFGDYAVLTLR